jgi:hypothetical protein
MFGSVLLANRGEAAGRADLERNDDVQTSARASASPQEERAWLICAQLCNSIRNPFSRANLQPRHFIAAGAKNTYSERAAAGRAVASPEARHARR